MTVLITSGVLTLAAIRASLRRAPVITTITAGLLILGVQSGVLRLPSVIVAPLSRTEAALHAWQRQQSLTIGCAVAQSHALLSPASEPGQSPLGAGARTPAPPLRGCQ